MVHKIFTTENIHSVHTTWHKITKRGKTRVIGIAHMDLIGLCAAMTVTWLKKSIASQGRGIFNGTELGSLNQIAIIQGAYEMNTLPGSRLVNRRINLITALLNSQGLKPCRGNLNGIGFFPPEQVVFWALSNPGHSLYSFPGVDNSRHMIGMRCEGRTLQMFAPEEGLFQYSDVSSFKRHMRSYLITERNVGPRRGWALVPVGADL